ncbi:uncharacterized protein [Nicotiana tomentosiformis]|uniref:uncharacterized protein n=1 Tax=Nicotiana tomentosiformis TaxID=4098 RepID=UPI00388CE9D8
MGSMNVKVFDGSQRATIGEINLSLHMGPTWFDVEFQVLDISTTYNLLLRRPWIHADGAVASTLFQAVKFEWNHLEVIIHGDGSNPIYTNQTVPVIENRKKLGGETYHRIERVNAIEKDRWWSNKIEGILLWTWYEPDKDCFTVYHHIWMDEDDAEKTAFIMPWGIYCYKMMSFGVKNIGATYMRSMTTIFHDMIHKEIEVYVDDVIIKSKRSTNHIANLRKFFDRLRRYNLKLNRTKSTFGVPTGKLLGFIISHRGIELDPSKVKAIQDLPPPKNKKDVMSFLGRLNYISHFIEQSTVICEPIFRMLRKDAATGWTEECQKAFDKIMEHLFKRLILVPPEPGKPLLLYLSVFDRAFGCVLGQHDETGRKEQKLMPTGKLAKWQILLSEFDIVSVTQKVVKGQALADHLAENPVDGEYEPLKKYFPDEEVSFVGEDLTEAYAGWRMFYDGATNFKGVGIRAVLVSKTGQHYPVSAKLRFPCTKNMAEYEACILGLQLAIDMNVQELLVIGALDLLVHKVQGEWAIKNTKILPYLHCVQELIKRFTKIEFRHVTRVQNEFADALATLSSMIQPRQEFHRSYLNRNA